MADIYQSSPFPSEKREEEEEGERDETKKPNQEKGRVEGRDGGRIAARLTFILERSSSSFMASLSSTVLFGIPPFFALFPVCQYYPIWEFRNMDRIVTPYPSLSRTGR